MIQRENGQIQQHINGLEKKILKGCKKEGVRNCNLKSYRYSRFQKLRNSIQFLYQVLLITSCCNFEHFLQYNPSKKCFLPHQYVALVVSIFFLFCFALQLAITAHSTLHYYLFPNRPCAPYTSSKFDCLGVKHPEH